jgi:hypothetical protein
MTPCHSKRVIGRGTFSFVFAYNHVSDNADYHIVSQEKFVKTRTVIAYVGAACFIVFLFVMVGLAIDENFGVKGKIKEARIELNSISSPRVVSLTNQETQVEYDGQKIFLLTRSGEMFFVKSDIDKLDKWARKNNFVLSSRQTSNNKNCSLYNILSNTLDCFQSSDLQLENKTRTVNYYNENNSVVLKIVLSESNQTISIILGTEVLLS